MAKIASALLPESAEANALHQWKKVVHTTNGEQKNDFEFNINKINELHALGKTRCSRGRWDI